MSVDPESPTGRHPPDGQHTFSVLRGLAGTSQSGTPRSRSMSFASDLMSQSTNRPQAPTYRASHFAKSHLLWFSLYFPPFSCYLYFGVTGDCSLPPWPPAPEGKLGPDRACCIRERLCHTGWRTMLLCQCRLDNGPTTGYGVMLLASVLTRAWVCTSSEGPEVRGVACIN
jgi:hypothetical protein